MLLARMCLFRIFGEHFPHVRAEAQYSADKFDFPCAVVEVISPFVLSPSEHSQNEMIVVNLHRRVWPRPEIALRLRSGSPLPSSLSVSFSPWPWCPTGALLSPGLNPQGDFEVLVHHVADADGGDHLHEIWGQAPVEPSGPLCPDYVRDTAPAPPPATSWRHHIPVFLSSAVNSSGTIKLSPTSNI
ncbi:hypothetical protein JZ751_005290 [Albula glossodonta]|uniref:Uncharacterized protein n=1 Tax=Albula glossodonta TaxID=121402 RepID=A0A8T2NC69_9TELE|nr:hypothetical protein JZ751_005290 [Albula glossodonta]